jgi:hypothetical protein
MMRQLHRALILLLLVSITIGCVKEAPLRDLEPEDSTSPIASLPKIKVSSPSPSEPVKSLEPTKPTFSTNTPGPTSQPTPTSIPTISPEDLAPTLEYLSNDPPCSLACWWGIAPRFSTLDQARELLVVLDPNLREISTDDKVALVATIPIETDDPKHHVMTVRITSNEGIIRTIQVMNMPDIFPYRYRLSHLLGTGGPPDDVRIKTYTGSEDPPFKLLLFNVAHNYYALYSAKWTEVTSTRIIGCLEDTPDLVIGSWGDKPLDTVVEDPDLGIDLSEYVDLSTATGLSGIEFFDIYVEPSPACISTFIDVWEPIHTD